MIDHQIDEEMILIDEVSDEAVEAAAFIALGGLGSILSHIFRSSRPLRIAQYDSQCRAGRKDGWHDHANTLTR